MSTRRWEFMENWKKNMKRSYKGNRRVIDVSQLSIPFDDKHVRAVGDMKYGIDWCFNMLPYVVAIISVVSWIEILRFSTWKT